MQQDERQRTNQLKLKRFRARFKVIQQLPQIPQPPQEVKMSQAASIFSSQSSQTNTSQHFRRNLISRFGIKSLKDIKSWFISSYLLEISALEPQFYYSMSPSQLAAIVFYGARRIKLREERYEREKKALHTDGSLPNCIISQDILSEGSSLSSNQGTDQSSQFSKRRWPIVLEMLTSYSESVHLKPQLKKIYQSVEKHGESLNGTFQKYSELFPQYVYLLPRSEKKTVVTICPSTPINKIKVVSERMYSSGATTVSSETKGVKLSHTTLKPCNLSSELEEKKDPRLFLKARGSQKKEVQKTLWNIEPPQPNRFATTRAAMIVSKGIQNAQRTQK